MPVLAFARRDRRNQGMPQPRQETGAFTAIKDRVLAESLGQGITSSLRDEIDPKVASKSSTVRIPALSPIWRDAGTLRVRGGLGLLKSGAKRRAQECIWPESIECVIPQLVMFRRTVVLPIEINILRLRGKGQSASLWYCRLGLVLVRGAGVTRRLGLCQRLGNRQQRQRGDRTQDSAHLHIV